MSQYRESEIAYTRAALKAVCRRALERGQILPKRQVIADAMGVPVDLVRRAFDSLRQRGEVITRGPEVVMVTQ